MPELPEVETVARQLAPLLEGRRVESFEVFDPLLRLDSPEQLAGRRVEKIERAGKQILISFSAGKKGTVPIWAAIHLRMTGRLLWVESAKPIEKNPPPGPLRARWQLDQGWLLFHDTRRFGTIQLLDSFEAMVAPGADPMVESFDGAALRALLRGATQPIKPWLLRQDRLTGVGNIYASEALHAAKIHPAREAGSLTAAESARLAESLRDVMARAIVAGGTTFSDFQNARGDVGNYQKNLRVYGHAGDPCFRCGTAIVKMVQAQRATYFCPKCQRAPRRKSAALKRAKSAAKANRIAAGGV